jgi:beta-aspartyl-peptidase (threonine type)
LLVGPGASRLAASRGVARCEPSTFLVSTGQALDRVEGAGACDTVGAIARDDEGRIAVAVSTGGYTNKLPGRVGDSPLVGCGFYADDALGGVCATGRGEDFMRLVLSHRTATLLTEHEADEAARLAIDELGTRTTGTGGLIVIDHEGRIGAAWNTAFMPWAQRSR